MIIRPKIVIIPMPGRNTKQVNSVIIQPTGNWEWRESPQNEFFISSMTMETNITTFNDNSYGNSEHNASVLSYLKLHIEYCYLLLVSATPCTGLDRLDKMLENSFWTRLGTAVGQEYGNRYSRLFNWVGVGPYIIEIAFTDWIDNCHRERKHSGLESEKAAKRAATLEYQLDLFLELCNFLDTHDLVFIYDCFMCDDDDDRFVEEAFQHLNISVRSFSGFGLEDYITNMFSQC
jgi:hypothetical protein